MSGGGRRGLLNQYFAGSKSAFTLSEVLISLVIIGVVAAITVPSLMQRTERQETVSKVKKVYSVLGQAVIKIAQDTGYPVGDFSFAKNDDFFSAFSKVVNINRICTKSGQGCFTSSYLKTIDGKNWAKYDNSNSLVTLDGVAYGWASNHDNCSNENKGLSQEDADNCIGRFIVDLNGGGPPNRFGYDIFFFIVVDGKGIVPAGNGNNSIDCKRGSNGGVQCAAKILKDGEINYL